jgi:hypothetical protein
MSLDRKQDLQLVTLKGFYDCSAKPEAQELFMKMIALKLKGYLHEYASGVLPVDTTDYLGVHHILCRWVRGEYVPIMAYKSVGLEACVRHNILFPALAIVGWPGSPETREDTREAVKGLLGRCEKGKISATYDSSWTIDPETRRDRQLVRKLRDIFLTAHLFHTAERAPNMSVICGIFRFKTERFFADWGYRPIETPDGSDPLFNHAFLRGEKAIMMSTAKYSDCAWATARNNEALWRDRIVIEGGDAEAKEAA